MRGQVSSHSCQTRSPLSRLANRVMTTADRLGATVATAESCTGGELAGLLTDVDCVAHRFVEGFVAYSDMAKSRELDVPQVLMDLEGPVTAPVAKLMAQGAVRRAQADVAVAITGFAGPGDEPGLVYVATCDRRGNIRHEEHRFEETDRRSVRDKSMRAAMNMLEAALLDLEDSEPEQVEARPALFNAANS